MGSNSRITSTGGLFLIGICAVLLGVAFLMTPENLIDLGPLRRSLTSDKDMVRDTAKLEVAFF